jgi:ParB family chromosome partitioning protein
MATAKDLKDRRSNFFSSDSAPGSDRFAKVEQIIKRQPTGTTVAAEDPATEVVAGEGTGPLVVDVSETLDNPLNARHAYKEARIVKLAASISQHGQLAPAIACSLEQVVELAREDAGAKGLLTQLTKDVPPTVKYLLIGGHYRKYSIARLPVTRIELKHVPIRSLLELYALSYAENDEREGTTPLDDALAWQNLLALGIAKTQDDISRVTNKPRVNITKTLSLLKLPQEVQDIFREAEAPFSFIAGYLLSQLDTHLPLPKMKELAVQIVQGTIKTRALEAMLESFAGQGRKRKEREISRQHKILTSDGAELGTIKDWDSGRVTLDVRIADETQRAKLVQELRDRFGTTA